MNTSYHIHIRIRHKQIAMWNWNIIYSCNSPRINLFLCNICGTVKFYSTICQNSKLFFRQTYYINIICITLRELNSVYCVDRSLEQFIKIQMDIIVKLSEYYLKLCSDIEYYNKINSKIFSSIYCETCLINYINIIVCIIRGAFILI